MGLISWTEGSVIEYGVTLASCLCAAAHCGILHRVPVLPGADRPLQAGQGGFPVLRPHVVHALRGDQRGTHSTAHAAQLGLCCPCGLGESQCPGAWDTPAPHPAGTRLSTSLSADHGGRGHAVLSAVTAVGTRRGPGRGRG